MQVKAKPVGAMPKKVTDKTVEINPGSKDKQFQKTTQPQGKTGKTGSPTGPANMTDVQFNKQQSKMGNQGSLGSPNGGSNMQDEQFNKPGQSPLNRSGKTGTGVVSGGMSDKQFTNTKQPFGKTGNASAGKKTPGTVKNQTAGLLSKAHKIMQAVAKYAQNPNGSLSKGKGHGDGITRVSAPHGSKSQTDSFKNSGNQPVTGRAKSQNRGFVSSEKAPESSPGSKTAGVIYKGKDKGTGSV